ncbi:MAG: winged helix DNA-binding protein [Nitrososphaerota archaeon]
MQDITIFFAALLAIQTVIFLLILRRIVTQLDITRMEALAARLMELERRLQRQRPEQGDGDEPNPSAHITPTALAALRLINERGSVTSSDVTNTLKMSREHVARLLKNLYEAGLVSREGKPCRYSLTEKSRRLISQ